MCHLFFVDFYIRRKWEDFVYIKLLIMSGFLNEVKNFKKKIFRYTKKEEEKITFKVGLIKQFSSIYNITIL